MFDISDITEEELPYLGVLKAVLGYMDTEHYNYADLANEINLMTGGISSQINIYAVKLDVEKGAWYKIGVNMQNPTAEDIDVYVTVRGVEVRIESKTKGENDSNGESAEEQNSVTPQNLERPQEPDANEDEVYEELNRVVSTIGYMGETVRAGIGSIDMGQREGAWAMGMSSFKTMLYVVLPQAFKNIIPEMANTFLTNLKMTSVLNVIAVQELFMAAKTVGGNYYKYFESYLVIAVIYFVLCFVFDKIFKFIEKKMQGKTDYALAIEYMDNQ